MKNELSAFISDENAQTIPEYALITFVFVLASYGAIKLFISAWKIRFDKISSMRAGPLGIGP